MEDIEYRVDELKTKFIFSKDNIDNSSYLAYGLERLLPLRRTQRDRSNEVR